MKQVKLAGSDSTVSALCLGTLYMGTKEDEATSFNLLDQYAEAGGSFLDTANIYSFWIAEHFKGGESEALVGRWMKARGNREDMFVATKLGISYPGQENGLSAKQIEIECDKSLKALQTDYIDMYFAHADDWITPQEETMQAFHSLLKKGKIRNLGASNFDTWRIVRANQIAEHNGWTPYSVIQNRHTYLQPKKDGALPDLQIVMTPDMIDYASKNNITLMAYTATLNASYNLGVKSEIPDAYATGGNKERLKVVSKISRDVGASPLQVVLAWMMACSPPVIPLITGSTKEQIAENIGSLDVKLSKEMIVALDQADETLVGQLR